MRMCSGVTRHVARGLTAAALVALVATSASAQALGKGREGAFTKRSVTLKDQGSFFIGGVNKSTIYAATATPNTPTGEPGPVNASIVIGQMYVQFQIPEGWSNKAAKEDGKYPVVMVHGSTHTGAALESTPDYKEGWGPYYVRNGLPVFIVDQAGRGRSGFDESVIHEGKAKLLAGDLTAGAAIPNIGRITNNGAYTSWFGHLVQPGTATPCLNILNCELKPHGWRSDDPSLPTVHPNPAGYLPTFPLSGIGLDPGQTQGGSVGSNTPTGVGPLAPLPTYADAHFGPAPYGPADAYRLHYYKQLVPNAEVTLPGSWCESCVPQTIAPTGTWTPYALALLVEKIGSKAGGAVVATHSQSGIMGHHMVRILRERGTLKYLKGLITVEGSCSFPNSGLTAADFDKIPYMAIKGDYTAISAVCQASVDAINARRTAGLGQAKSEYIQLDDPKYHGEFNGVSHMMMDDTNALDVADVMLEWGSKYIRGEGRRGRDD
ncbi:MAG: hypothetical protein QOH59_3070 [Gemmatimonadales bacterium]|nr:hypothetical protein [Gemmatimonadales bacterium]